MTNLTTNPTTNPTTKWSLNELFGTPVLTADKRNLGRLEGIVHRANGRRAALVVQRGWFRSTSSIVPLAGAEISGGAIHLHALASYLGGPAHARETAPYHAA